MLRQNTTAYKAQIEQAIADFIRGEGMNRNTLASMVGADEKQFYNMLGGQQSWKWPLLFRTYQEIRLRSEPHAAALARAILDDPQITIRSEADTRRERLMEVVSRAGQACSNGADDAELSDALIELGLQFRKQRGR